MAVAVVTLAGGVPEEDVVVKQDDVCCNRDVGGPEEDAARKQNGADCNRDWGVPEEDVVGKICLSDETY